MIKKGRHALTLAAAGTFALAVGLGGAIALGPGQAQAATVKAASVSKGTGVYKTAVKQTTVGKTKASIGVAKRTKLAKAGIKKIKVTATISYEGKTAVTKSKTVKVSKLSKAKSPRISFMFPSLGSYKVKLSYYGKKNRVIKSTSLKKVGIAAQHYNIALFNGTYPVLMFSMGLFDDNDITKGGTAPTYVALSRTGAYDWQSLPTNVHSIPLLKTAKSGNYSKRRAATAAYVKNLRQANKNSDYDFWVTDNGIANIFNVMYKNGVTDSHLRVHMLSDGSGSASWFNDVYNVENANPDRTNLQMVVEWNEAKQAALSGETPDYASMKYVINKGKGSLCLSKYAYAALSAQGKYDWWIGYGGLFASTDSGFLSYAKSRMTMFSIASDLTTIEEHGNSQAFKQLYHLSDSMFSKAIAENKKPMVIMGTRVTSEKNFEPFVRFLEKYYGSDYEYYYKGHPGTPTSNYPEKQKQLKELGVTDIDSSIAAELIVFYNPEIYVSGLSNSTLNSSYQKGHTLAYLGTRLADKDKITSGDLFQVFFTKVDTSYEQGILDLVKDDPNLEHTYLGELNDGTGDVLVYDDSKGTISKYAPDGNGGYIPAAQ